MSARARRNRLDAAQRHIFLAEILEAPAPEPLSFNVNGKHALPREGIAGIIRAGDDRAPATKPEGHFRMTDEMTRTARPADAGAVETVGLGLHFEDLPVGRKFRTVGRTVTEADIVNFVNATGMTEVLFTNLEFLREESDIKRRVAPGALGYCFAEGLLIQATMQHTGFAFLHMELDIENPVFAGDTLHVECEVIESRRSKSRPGRGLVRTRNRVVKQDGTVAITYTPLRMIKARTSG